MNNAELKRMISAQLDAFDARVVPLHQLLGELKSLQDSFCAPTPVWMSEFDRLRFALEEVNAIRLAEDNFAGNIHEDFVKDTVKQLITLLSAR